MKMIKPVGLHFFVRNILSFILLLFAFNATAQKGYSSETQKKINEVENNICGSILLNGEKPVSMLERMAKYNVKGLSIAVIENYQVVWAKGYGWANEEEKIPVTTETLFEPGSISKTLNAVGILKLAQDGRVNLFTDINSMLKSWKFPYDSLSGGKKITLAHLLSHTAGLSVHGFPGHDIHGPVPTIYEVLDGKSPALTSPVRSEFEPGLKHMYSGGGTSISQVLLTDIVQQQYDIWMDENILKPLGMLHSTFAQPPSAEKQRSCATGYSVNGTPVPGKFHVYPEQAAAGLWMTPTDLCNYIIDMQLAWKGGKSKVLNNEMVKLHLTPYIDESAAMGTFIEDHNGVRYFQHGAANDGFSGQFYGSMEKGYGVVVFLNSDYSRLINEVINSVAKAYQWENFYVAPQQRTSIKLSDETIKQYAGIYIFDNYWVAIGEKDKEFHYYQNQTYAKMHFLTTNSFFNEEFKAIKEMVKDEQGNVIGFDRIADGKKLPGAVKVGSPDTLKLANQSFSEIGWYLFEIRNYKEALAYFSRGSQLYPEDLNMLINKAHFCLLNNDYEGGLAIYKSHLADSVREGYSWKDLMTDDFKYLKDAGVDMKLFQKVFAELKIRIPE